MTRVLVHVKGSRRGMEEAAQRGLARSIGVSNFGPRRLAHVSISSSLSLYLRAARARKQDTHGLTCCNVTAVQIRMTTTLQPDPSRLNLQPKTLNPKP
jgi:hypothetical protein